VDKGVVSVHAKLWREGCVATGGTCFDGKVEGRKGGNAEMCNFYGETAP
jgi:hypothetical protein